MTVHCLLRPWRYQAEQPSIDRKRPGASHKALSQDDPEPAI